MLKEARMTLPRIPPHRPTPTWHHCCTETSEGIKCSLFFKRVRFHLCITEEGVHPHPLTGVGGAGLVVGLTQASDRAPPDPEVSHLQNGANGGVRGGLKFPNMLGAASARK